MGEYFSDKRSIRQRMIYLVREDRSFKRRFIWPEGRISKTKFIW